MKIFAKTGSKKMMYLLITLVALVILDGLLTELLLGNGLAQESNPFLQPWVGDAGFMALKVIGSLLCAFILWDIYRRFPRVAVIATWIAVVGYALIVAWNSSLFLLA